MPTLTEDVDLPGGVDPASVRAELRLWGSGVAVTGFESGTGKTIAGVARATGNPWTIASVVGNADIDIPAGTVYQAVRTWPGLDDPLINYVTVPSSGGPYRVDQILTDPPDDLPSITPSNELDVAENTTGATGLSMNAFNIVAIPGTALTVAVNTRPVHLKAQGWIQHSVANANIAVMIAPVGSTLIGQQIATGMAFVGAAGKEASPIAWARLAVGASGSFQAFVYADTGGLVDVIASVSNPARLASFAM